MTISLNEVSYSPLALEQSFKVQLQDEKCTVMTSNDLYLNSFIAVKNNILHLNVQDYEPKLQELLLIQLEYLLTHLPELKQVQLEGATTKLGSEFNRSEFFQLPTLWHYKRNIDLLPEKWTQTNGVDHPVRPLTHNGYVYRRHIPQLGKEVSLRLIDIEKDLDTFHEWHNQSRVSFFWELNKPKEELKEYISKGLKDSHQIPLIVEVDRVPVGYYEMYWVREDRLGPYYESDAFDRGFHFLIGNKKFLGYSTTDSIIKSALHFLFLDDPRTRRIMAEPRHDNQKVLKYAEASIGWKNLKIFDFPHKRAYLLQNSREIFFNGNAL
jgi:acetyl CoA:N6-hydroxylysine acetyl transferase